MGEPATWEWLASAVPEALINGLWQGVVITAAVVLLLRLLPGAQAAVRHAVWLLTLLGITMLPVLTLALDRALGPATAGDAWPSAVVAGSGSGAQDPAPETGRGMAAGAWRPVEVAGGRWLLVVGLGTALVSLVRMTRLGASLRSVGALKRGARPLPATERERLRGLLDGGWRGRWAELRLSDDLASPITAGYLRPAVLLPTWLPERLSDEELRCVVLHELAHIRRCDDWTVLAQRALEAVFFFHPAVHWIGRRLETERELACDRLVAGASGSRAYARCLVRLAELARNPRPLALAPGVASAPSQLELRLRALVGASGAPVPWMSPVAGVAGAGLLAAVTAALVLAGPVLVVGDGAGKVSSADLVAVAPAAGRLPAVPSHATEPAADPPVVVAVGTVEPVVPAHDVAAHDVGAFDAGTPRRRGPRAEVVGAGPGPAPPAHDAPRLEPVRVEPVALSVAESAVRRGPQVTVWVSGGTSAPAPNGSGIPMAPVPDLYAGLRAGRVSVSGGPAVAAGARLQLRISGTPGAPRPYTGRSGRW